MANKPRHSSDLNGTPVDVGVPFNPSSTITNLFGWAVLLIGLSISLFLFYRIYTVVQYPDRHAATMQYWGESIGEDVTKIEVSGNVIIHEDGSLSIPEPIFHDRVTTETLSNHGTEVSGLPVLKVSIKLGQVIGYGIAIILMLLLIKIAFGLMTIGAQILEKPNQRVRRKGKPR